MRKALIYIVTVAATWPLFASQNPPEDHPAVVIRSYDALTPHALEDFDKLKAGDMAIFDLDNTVFRETQMLGTDEWYEDVAFQIGHADAPFANKEELHRVNDKIKRSSQMKLMEVETPALIERLQRRGVITIGLTARHPNLASPTVAWLNHFGIDFTRRSFSDKRFRFWKDMGLNRDFAFFEGIAFVDGAPKGPVLKAILHFVAHTPSRAIAIDDRIKHVNGFVETFWELGIRADVIHYLKVREEPAYDPKVAKIQLTAFLATGQLVPDNMAQLLLAANDCESALQSKGPQR